MNRHLLMVLFAVGFPAVVFAAPPKPAVEIRLKAVKDLAPIVEYVGGLANQAEAGKQWAGILTTLAKDENGYEGLDLGKPIGAYIGMAEAVEDSAIVIMVPVLKEEAVIEAIKTKLGFDPKKDKDVYSLEVPGVPFPVFMRFTNGYAYVTIRSESSIAEANIIVPKDFFAAKVGKIVSATIDFERYPTDVKKAIYGQLEMTIQDGLSKVEPTAAQKILNTFWSDIVVDAAKTILNDGEKCTVSLDALPSSDDVKLSFGLGGKSGTTLAKTIEGFGDRDSLAAGLVPSDSAASLALQFLVPPETKKKLETMTTDLLKLAESSGSDSEKAALPFLTKVVMPLLQSGDFQLMFAVKPATRTGKAALTTALKLDEGDNFRTLLQLGGIGIQSQKQGKFEASVAKIGERKLHKFTFDSIPETFLFDASTTWVVTSEDLMIATTGETDAGIKAMAKASAKKVPMLSVVMGVESFAPIVFPKLTSEELKKAMDTIFGEVKAKGRDQLAITATGGKRFDFNITLKGKAIVVLTSLGTTKED